MGGWVGNNGDLITEKITIVYSYCKEEQLQEHIEAIYNYCLKIKKEMNQEAVSLEVNNKLHLI